TPAMRQKRIAALSEGGLGHQLWPDLDVKPEDEIVKKYRYSGFLPGTSDLADRLRARGFDTVLITGTVTNVCCESSARDANMMNFRTIMVSDGNAALTQAEHDASLTAFYATFGDVMDTEMIITALDRAAVASAAPSEAEGSMPSEPVSIAAQSDNKSPNRLLVTMTSNCFGLRTSCIAQLSAYMKLSSTSE